MGAGVLGGGRGLRGQEGGWKWPKVEESGPKVGQSGTEMDGRAPEWREMALKWVRVT